MRNIIIKSGQSLFDIALQVYGSLEGVFGLLADNATKITTLADKLEPGMVLNVSGTVLNKYIVDEYANRGIIPATAISAGSTTGEGIGWWIIENDFIVQ